MQFNRKYKKMYAEKERSSGKSIYALFSRLNDRLQDAARVHGLIDFDITKSLHGTLGRRQGLLNDDK